MARDSGRGRVALIRSLCGCVVRVGAFWRLCLDTVTLLLSRFLASRQCWSSPPPKHNTARTFTQHDHCSPHCLVTPCIMCPSRARGSLVSTNLGLVPNPHGWDLYPSGNPDTYSPVSAPFPSLHSLTPPVIKVHGCALVLSLSVVFSEYTHSLSCPLLHTPEYFSSRQCVSLSILLFSSLRWRKSSQ